MPVLLSDEELNALTGITDIQYRLYISGIRRYMDYKTGITGIKRKISYQSLSEEIYVDPKQGNKNGGARSKDQVKRALKALETAGLITVHSIVTKTKKQLILKCALAITDDSAQNKAALLPPHSAAPRAALVENSQNTTNIDTSETGLSESRPTSRPLEIEKAAAHPVSGKDTNLHTNVLGDDSKMLTQAEANFLNLFAKYRLPINLLRPQAETLEMVRVWVSKGVTPEHAETKIKDKLIDNENLGITKLPSPLYFFDRVIEYKQFLESANSKLKEPTDETHRLRPAVQSKTDSRRDRYKKILR